MDSLLVNKRRIIMRGPMVKFLLTLSFDFVNEDHSSFELEILMLINTLFDERIILSIH